jgi:hypothetical protein
MSHNILGLTSVRRQASALSELLREELEDGGADPLGSVSTEMSGPLWDWNFFAVSHARPLLYALSIP